MVRYSKKSVLGLAIAGWALVLVGCGSSNQAVAPASNVPDLSGWWNGSAFSLDMFVDGTGDLSLPARDNDLGNFEKDFAVMERREDHMPQYKPEYWEEIRHNDYYGLIDDPVFVCLPNGVPRMGAPHKIIQTEDEVVLFYSELYPEGDVYRIIPVDGRDFDPLQINDLTWLGHSIGHWEGNTLVIESVGFNDESWLGWAGWTHSNQMTVTERLWREGDLLHWQATVHDPVMLLEPWTTERQTRRLNTNEHVWVHPALPCEEKDADRIVDPTVRG